jgi:KEOPS complex subunit Cgi121
MIKSLVVGAKGKIRKVESLVNSVNEWAKERKLFIQIFDGDKVCGRLHLVSALEHALRAFRENKNSAFTLELETLLYASGKRQISEAIEHMGIKEGKNRSVVLLFASLSSEESGGKLPTNGELEEMLISVGLNRNDKTIEGNTEKAKAFGITEKEIESVPKNKTEDLVLERVAMVDVLKS